ncbi:MAG: MotA/TolQ/ExbB proton channel family protein [Elusimicrobia bacterium]|nr:MotA/TolQ/ExbB proton channel family protein [Elusimicrobiota bacterium]
MNMDMMTLIGVMIGVGLFALELSNNQMLGVFINTHGLFLVLGGTLAGLLVNTPLAHLRMALGGLRMVWFPPRFPSKEDVIEEMVGLAEQARREGISSLRINGIPAGNGFLSFAVKVVLQNPDAEHVKKVLADAIRQNEVRHSTVAGIFQTVAVLAPMFGLLGTLVGIVNVLKDITNPKGIGPAMAVAITTAFYGIGLACLFATPLTGKLRLLSSQEKALQEIVAVGILDILAGKIPLEVESHLKAYLGTHERLGV